MTAPAKTAAPAKAAAPAARAAATARAAAPLPPSYATRPEVIAFADRMVAAHGFERDGLLRLFAQLRPSERVIQLITPPPGPSPRRSWREYRARFIEPVRISGGLEFWQRHGAELKLASALYGVPEEIIVAILGVETIYGRNTGNFRVIEALATLAFDYPSRADYFRSELEQFLLLARENRIDPLEPLGSYAGAIGTPQFMPGSIRRFAVDFDQDGRIDLRRSAADTIGSVASFLKQHGWVEGKPTHFPVTIDDPTQIRAVVEAGPQPNFTILELGRRGITSDREIAADEPLLLADLINAEAPTDYVLGTRNFYAITRYNRSYMYALAVAELAAELRARRDGSGE
ncbi:MAG: lytic murein transglycosylase B [Lautropia sp.]